MKVDFVQQKALQIGKILEDALPGTDVYPESIHEAMRYAVLGGGKRLRAILALGACEAVGGNPHQAQGFAAALEMIHAYSLVHDDLPSMDDDDLRRGKPATHIQFGEALAILTGDALLTEAFAELARMPEKYNVSPQTTVQVMLEVASASGSEGMVGGQVVDIESAGSEPDAETLEYIHRHKTGSLFRAALRGGAVIGGATGEQLESITSYADNFGLAFQITDDILDEVGQTGDLGKAVGSDKRLAKLTFPSLYGLDRSREIAQACIDKCHRALSGFSDEAWILRELAVLIARRDH